MCSAPYLLCSGWRVVFALLPQLPTPIVEISPLLFIFFTPPGTNMAHIRLLCAMGTASTDRYWLSTDVCGLLCCGFTYFIHIYSLLVCRDIVLNENLWEGAVGTILRWSYYFSFVMALANHIMAMFTNPGAGEQLSHRGGNWGRRGRG